MRSDTGHGHTNMQQLIELRWIAVVGQIVTIALVSQGLGIPLPLLPLGLVVGALAAFNAASALYLRRARTIGQGQLFVALLVDVVCLTAELYWCGGLGNPFVFLYLLQVTVGAVLLSGWWSWALVPITAACVAVLGVWAQSLQSARLALHATWDLSSLYVQGLLVCFVLDAGLLVWFIKRINAHVRERDLKLANLRQHKAESEHIVRMGLLASGAAHELSTPLATLSVILGDWQHMAPVLDNDELQQDVAEMQQQIQRCKQILSGILLSAGEARSDSLRKSRLGSYFADVAAQWQRHWPLIRLDYRQAVQEHMEIAVDAMVGQMLHSLLDNAREAGSQQIRMVVELADDDVLVRITDTGCGFPPHILEQWGKPYVTTKGRPGGGLGLYLASNVARTLGGQLSAANQPDGGAIVSVRLPLAAFKI